MSASEERKAILRVTEAYRRLTQGAQAATTPPAQLPPSEPEKRPENAPRSA
jgi:hypothetical protein